MCLPSNEEVPMRTPEEMLEELSKLSTADLQMAVDMHILFRDDAPIEIIKEHHSFQTLARSVLNQRMGGIKNDGQDEFEISPF
jgi:hypothetical protein